MTLAVERSQVLLLAAQAARLLLFVGATSLLGRQLTPADFALVALVSGLFIVAAEVMDLGTAAITTRDIAAQPASEHERLAALLALRRLLAAAVALAVLLLAWSPLVPDARHRPVLSAAAVGVYLLHLHAYHPAFQWRQAYGAILALGLSGQAAFLAGSALALQLQAGGAVVALLVVLREAALAFSHRWAAIRLMGRRLRAPWWHPGMAPLLRQAWMLGVAGVSYKLAVYGGVFLLFTPHSLEALASFSAAHRLLVPSVELAWLFVNPLFAALSVALVRSEQDFRVQLSGQAQLMLGLSSTVAVALALLAPSWLGLLYGPTYATGSHSAVVVSQWLAIGAVFAWMTPVFVVAETTRGHLRALMGLGLACLALALAGNLWAVPRWGAEGAAVVLVACEALVCIGLLLRSLRRHEIRSGAGWLWCLGPAGLLVAVLQMLDGHAGWQGVVALAWMPATLYVLKRLPAQRDSRASMAALAASPLPETTATGHGSHRP